MKSCVSCGAVKGAECFSRRARAKDGLKPTCKQCDMVYMRARYYADPDAMRAKKRKYNAENQEKIAARKRMAYLTADPIARKGKARAYYEQNKEVLLEKYKVYAIANADKVKSRARHYYELNKEVLIKKQSAYIKANPEVKKRAQDNYFAKNKATILSKGRNRDKALPEKKAERGRAWRFANPALINTYNARRRSARLQRHRPYDPELLELVEVEAYALAKSREIVTNFKWEVDHTVPLQGRTVSGLHNEYNLSCVPRAINRSKSNRYWPDMPAQPS